MVIRAPLHAAEVTDMRFSLPATLSAIVLFSFTLAGSIARAGSKAQEVQTFWAATPVQADGQMTEWPGDRTTYVEGRGVLLGLSNDGRNLYILFRFSDPAWARSVRMSGLTLWLDNTGKKKKDFGIRYYGGPSVPRMRRGESPGDGSPGEKPGPEEGRAGSDMEMPGVDQITVIDKKSDHEESLFANGSSGPAAGFGSVEGTYTYEFSIPLQAGDAARYGIGTEPGRPISLGLEWGGLEMAGRKHVGHPGGEHRDEGPGGDRPDGERRGRGGHGPWGDRGGADRKPPEKQVLWVKTSLASPPPK
jgi:hypothetical protein